MTGASWTQLKVKIAQNITTRPELSVRCPTQQFASVVTLRQPAYHLVADNGVALARHVFETFAVNNNDPAPGEFE